MNDRSRALRSRSGERIVTRGSGVMEPRSFYRFRADIAPRLTSDVSHRFAARSVSLSRCFLTGGGGGGRKNFNATILIDVDEGGSINFSYVMNRVVL